MCAQIHVHYVHIRVQLQTEHVCTQCKVHSTCRQVLAVDEAGGSRARSLRTYRSHHALSKLTVEELTAT